MQVIAHDLRLPALIRVCRPHQWVKNLLVATAPLAAGALWQPRVTLQVTILFLVLCAASSAGYIVNDIKDCGYDRAHPDKRNRPIASGELPVRAAASFAVLLACLGLLLALLLFDVAVFLGILGYIAISWSYSLGLKRIAGIEMLLVSTGFVARAVVGGLGTGTRLSAWFLLFIGVAALFVVVGKRLSEMGRVDQFASDTLVDGRFALRRYTSRYLRGISWLSVVVAIGSYVTWVVTRGVQENEPLILALSAVPLAVCFARYAVLIARGRAEAPEEALLKDTWIVASSMMWLVLFAVSVNLGA